MASNKCMFCGGKATLLCDFLLGFDAEEDESGNIITLRKNHTCDAPMCASCSTFHGNLHWRKGRSGGCESIDYCPICESQEVGFGRHYIFDDIGQVKIYRQAHYAKFNSAKGNHLSVIRGGGQICLDL
ncbi:hypothetical protein AB7360_15000 [Providencia alcalifaciens]|uniref:hypothetical protein n=1 Tax=Providencia alcalifaciens TaxID=126385 RepID=UPI0029E68567|nr:hypothetical protein [Providencia rettgeri]